MVALITRVESGVLFVVLLFDLYFHFSGANREMVLAIAVLAIILPTVTAFSGFGFSFKAALADSNMELERVLAKLEECCEGTGENAPPLAQRLGGWRVGELPPKVLEGAEADVVREKLLVLLRDKAFSMRSIEVLSRRTRLSEDQARQVLGGMKDVSRVHRTDGAEFWGLTPRVRDYLRRNR